MPGFTAKRGVHGRRWIAAVVCLAMRCTVPVAGGQVQATAPLPPSLPPPPLTIEQIAGQVQRASDNRTLALHSYESVRVMTLSLKGRLADTVASETVRMTYTAPASKQFVILSANGSPLLRDSVFQRAMDSEQEAAGRGDTRLTPANYEMKLLGTERLPEGECYVLSINPRHLNRFTYRGRIWVQSTDFAVVRVDAEPVETPSFWIKSGSFHMVYSKVGDFWFPQRMVSNSRIRLGGEAVLTIQYGPYRLLNANPLRGGGDTGATQAME